MASVQPLSLDINSLDVSDNLTVTTSHSGLTLNVVVDNKVVTLPAVATSNVGLCVTVRAGGVLAGATAGSNADGSALVTVSPNSADKIMGLGQAGTDDKDILLPKADMRIGDYVTLQSDGVNGWFVVRSSGKWTFQG